ncbi:eukaryotic translation initiation factor 3 subunit b [Anaeramoeba ignava]|uniref:Eukaryotic translation initiation factor 3 subunit b n=1 Tax=Anaeramoeba ignava TaxID=1746090 RepID=A0A9Q0R7H8_ANAIG|nr:eukaryotic translation initiation factor 3 subunit b [Anaeramoeba ignava]
MNAKKAERDKIWEQLESFNKLEEEIKKKEKEKEELIKEYEELPTPNPELSYDSDIIVKNIPIIGGQKLELLKKVLEKTFSEAGKYKIKYLSVPFDKEANKTKGYCFVSFEDKETAELMTKKLHNKPFDKQHTFEIYSFEYLKTVEEFPDELPKKDYSLKDDYDLLYWLLDPNLRDQYVIATNLTASVMWCDFAQEDDEMDFELKTSGRRTEWSPHGLFLTITGVSSLDAYCGKEWGRFQSLRHDNIKTFQFCPNERFLITHSKDASVVWDLWIDNRKRKFKIPKIQLPENQNRKKDKKEPKTKIDKTDLRKLINERIELQKIESKSPKALIHSTDIYNGFAWNFDGTKFARLNLDQIQFYDIPSLDSNPKHPIPIPNIQEISFSPKENLLVYWTKATDSANLSKIVFMEIPSLQIVKSHNLVLVEDCEIFWHPKGNHVAVIVTKYSKTLKSISGSSVELFNLNSKEILHETIDFKSFLISNFEWDPEGSTFIFATEPAEVKSQNEAKLQTIRMYTTQGHAQLTNDVNQNKVEVLKTIPDIQLRDIVWSSKGRYFIVVVKKGYSYVMEFWDSSNFTKSSIVDLPSYTRGFWDPTGSFLMIFSENNREIQFYTFQGALIKTIHPEGLKFACWRPRIEILSESDKKKIQEDAEKKMNDLRDKPQIQKEPTIDKSKSKELEKQQMRKTFIEYYQKKKEERLKEKQERKKIKQETKKEKK